MTMAKVLEPGTVLPWDPDLAALTTVELTGKEAETESYSTGVKANLGLREVVATLGLPPSP